MPSRSRVSWTSISRRVSRNAEFDAVFGGMYIERYDAPRSGATRRRLARDERVRRHRRAEHPVEAEHELVGPVVVGEEPRDVEPVHLVGAGDGVARHPVQRVGAGADEAEQPRAVPEHVVEEPGRLPAARLEEAGRERVRDDEVPVAPRARGGDGVERLVPGEQRDRDEERAVLQPLLRAVDRARAGRRRAGSPGAAPCGRAPGGARSRARRPRSRSGPARRPPARGARRRARRCRTRTARGSSRPLPCVAVDLPAERLSSRCAMRRGDALEVGAVAGESVVEGDRRSASRRSASSSPSGAPASCAGSRCVTPGSPYSAITSAASSASANENSSYWLPTLYRQVSARSWIEQAPLGVVDDRLGDVEDRARAEPGDPEVDEPGTGGVVRRLRRSRPGRRRTARARRRRASCARRARPGRSSSPGRRARRGVSPRGRGGRGAAVAVACVGGQADEADQVARPEAAHRERLLLVPGAAGVPVLRLQDRQVAARRGAPGAGASRHEP